MAIDGINGGNVENWRSKPVKEVVSNLEIVEEEDAEVAQWAQAMAAMANAPDNVTYSMAGGSTEAFTEEMNKITENGGVQPEEKPEDKPEAEAAVGKAGEVPPEEEEPKVGDVDKAGEKDPNAPVAPEEEVPPEEDVPPAEGEEGDEDNPDDLADKDITTDDETIRKRKAKKGEEPEE